MTQSNVEIKNLSKSFGNLKAVDDISITINPGEIFGFLGPNGAGKTTTINMICGLLKPDEGEIRINGESIYSKTQNVFRKIGICPQTIMIWEKLTCLEQLCFIGQMYGLARGEIQNRSNEILEKLGLQDKRNQLASELSGGMQRRLNLALSLVHDPDLLILDEPEAGLDPQSRVLVRDFIKSMAQKKTIILTTHNMDEADRLSDRVAIIDHGKLLTVNSPEDLKKNIGEGDVIEFALKQEFPNSVKDQLVEMDIKVQQTDSILILRSKRMFEKISSVIKLFKENGLETSEINLRSNSLEDVFIALTGRKLRE